MRDARSHLWTYFTGEKAATAGYRSKVEKSCKRRKTRRGQRKDCLNRTDKQDQTRGAELKNQICHLTRLLSCGRLSSSVLRALIGRGATPSLHALLFSLPLLPVEAESGPWSSSSHTASSVSEVGRELIPALRRSRSPVFASMEAPPSSYFHKVVFFSNTHTHKQ